MGNAGRGGEWPKLVVGYGQGSTFGKLLDCVLLNSAENGKNQGFVVGEHILQVGPSRQLEDCTMAEEHEVAHLYESLEEVLELQVMTAVSVIVLSEPWVPLVLRG
jgi:hypothetical protein